MVQPLSNSAHPQMDAPNERPEVLGVLSNMANSCFQELGYFPGMNQKLLDTKKERNQLKEANERLLRQNKELFNQYNMLRKDVARMNEMIGNYANTFAHLGKPQQEQVQEIIALKSDLERMRAERDDFKRRNHELPNMTTDERCSKLQSKLEQLNRQYGQACLELDSIRNRPAQAPASHPSNAGPMSAPAYIVNYGHVSSAINQQAQNSYVAEAGLTPIPGSLNLYSTQDGQIVALRDPKSQSNQRRRSSEGGIAPQHSQSRRASEGSVMNNQVVPQHVMGWMPPNGQPMSVSPPIRGIASSSRQHLPPPSQSLLGPLPPDAVPLHESGLPVPPRPKSFVRPQNANSPTEAPPHSAPPHLGSSARSSPNVAAPMQRAVFASASPALPSAAGPSSAVASPVGPPPAVQSPAVPRLSSRPPSVPRPTVQSPAIFTPAASLVGHPPSFQGQADLQGRDDRSDGPGQRPQLPPIDTGAVAAQTGVRTQSPSVLESVPEGLKIKRSSSEPPEEAAPKRLRLSSDVAPEGPSEGPAQGNENEEDDDDELEEDDDPQQLIADSIFEVDEEDRDKLWCKFCRARYEGGKIEAFAPFVGAGLEELITHAKSEHEAGFKRVEQLVMSSD